MNSFCASAGSFLVGRAPSSMCGHRPARLDFRAAQRQFQMIVGEARSIGKMGRGKRLSEGTTRVGYVACGESATHGISWLRFKMVCDCVVLAHADKLYAKTRLPSMTSVNAGGVG